MRELIFEDSFGNRRIIATCKGYDDVMKCINAFMRVSNNKPSAYYVDMQEENNMTKISIGTHDGLFYVNPSLEVSKW